MESRPQIEKAVGRVLDLAAARKNPRMQRVEATAERGEEKIAVVAAEQCALLMRQTACERPVEGQRFLEIEKRQAVEDEALQPSVAIIRIARTAQLDHRSSLNRRLPHA